MIEDSNTGMHIHFGQVPVFDRAAELAGKGLMPGGLFRNRDFRADMVDFLPETPPAAQDILFDPQTSGGLIIAVAERDAQPLLAQLHEANVQHARIIGEITDQNPGRITVSN